MCFFVWGIDDWMIGNIVSMKCKETIAIQLKIKRFTENCEIIATSSAVLVEIYQPAVHRIFFLE